MRGTRELTAAGRAQLCAPAALALLLFAGCASYGGARAAPALAPRHTPVPSPARVAFTSIVNVDYAHGKDLDAWRAGSLVIRKTLCAWYPNAAVESEIVDPPSSSIPGALMALPGLETADFSIVYMASRQGPSGNWEQTGGEGMLKWPDVLSATHIRPHPGRIVILDACHGTALDDLPVWRARLAPAALVACAKGERTYEIDFSKRRPRDFSKRYPEAADWLRSNMPPDWDGRMSFLSLMWLEAWLETPRAPRDMDEWSAFLSRCADEAQEFRETHSRRLGSTITARPLTSVETAPRAR